MELPATPAPPHDCTKHPNVACAVQVRELIREELRAERGRTVEILRKHLDRALPYVARALYGEKLEAALAELRGNP